MEQHIRFCTSASGVRIAYATVGQGYPLVKAAHWLTHLEFDWRSPVWGHLWRGLAESHLVVRYDGRGTGLSDRDVGDMSFGSCVADLGAVVEALGLQRFALLGISQGGPVAMAYAASNPHRVSHLVLHGTFARWPRPRDTKEGRERFEAVVTLIRQGWGLNNASFRQFFTSFFIPDATAEQMRWFNDMERVSASPENAVRIYSQMAGIDARAILPGIKVPTLVLHSRGDQAVPFGSGRELASFIPGARFVPIESENHLPLEEEPAREVFLREISDFLQEEEGTVVPPVQPVTGTPPNSLTRREIEVLRLIAAGRSNRQIGQELVISTNTVDRHVSNILDKTGAANRAEAATYAVRQGLA